MIRFEAQFNNASQILKTQNLEKPSLVRVAVAEFKESYNCHWRLKKIGFMSPLELRQAYNKRMAA